MLMLVEGVGVGNRGSVVIIDGGGICAGGGRVS